MVRELLEKALGENDGLVALAESDRVVHHRGEVGNVVVEAAHDEGVSGPPGAYTMACSPPAAITAFGPLRTLRHDVGFKERLLVRTGQDLVPFAWRVHMLDP